MTAHPRPDVADVVIACVDVGSLANVGWWRRAVNDSAGGRDLDTLASTLASDLTMGRVVALGFEAPLFIPLPSHAENLNRQRQGERGRPWCAGAGTGALALGVQQAGYVLRAIASRLDVTPTVSFETSAFSRPGPALVLWEALVTGRAKDRVAIEPHIDDARVAVEELAARLRIDAVVSDIEEADVICLVGAAALAAGITEDVRLLRQPCVVVRAPDRVASR